MNKSSFAGDDYEFAAGAIVGMRSWGMDDKGRLHGVTHREVWRPGENAAVCMKPHTAPCPKYAKRKAVRSLDYTSPWRSGQIDWASVLGELTFLGPELCGAIGCNGATHPAEAQHTFDPTCECGFWAYNEADFTEHGDVTGLIEGYGKTTIGTRGFRSEKARIVAICRESKGEWLSLSRWLRLKQLYPEAKFYEDRDDMVTAHGAVLKQWAEVADGFWDEPVAVADDLSALTWALARSSASQSALSRALGGRL